MRQLCRKISLKQEVAAPADSTSSKFGWFGKKTPQEAPQKLVFSFSKESDPDFLDDVDISSPSPGSTPNRVFQKKENSPEAATLKKRTDSEHSMQTVPTMVIQETEEPAPAAARSGQNGGFESSYSGLQVRSHADRQDSTSMRSYRSVTNTVISSAKELEEEKQVKKQRFWDFLTMVLSMSYAITVVITGRVLYEAVYFGFEKQRKQVKRIVS